MKGKIFQWKKGKKSGLKGKERRGNKNEGKTNEGKKERKKERMPGYGMKEGRKTEKRVKIQETK